MHFPWYCYGVVRKRIGLTDDISSVVVSLSYSCLPFCMMSEVPLDDGKRVVMGNVVSYLHSLSTLLSDHLRPVAPWISRIPLTLKDTSRLLAL